LVNKDNQKFVKGNWQQATPNFQRSMFTEIEEFNEVNLFFLGGQLFF